MPQDATWVFPPLRLDSEALMGLSLSPQLRKGRKKEKTVNCVGITNCCCVDIMFQLSCCACVRVCGDSFPTGCARFNAVAHGKQSGLLGDLISPWASSSDWVRSGSSGGIKGMLFSLVWRAKAFDVILTAIAPRRADICVVSCGETKQWKRCWDPR